MGKIRESDDYFSPYSQCLLQYQISAFNLLKTLIQYHIVERLICIVG
jgi:hypothetical protein